MLHTQDAAVQQLLFDGNFGLERETLRITKDGFLSQTPHPFPNDAHIVRDFSENQIEINTKVCKSPDEAVKELAQYDFIIQEKLSKLADPEYLWPFSNPPYIRNWQDIPVAQFTGEEKQKTSYREYLSRRYGHYKMAFSGIHVNYSLSEDLLRANYEAEKRKITVESCVSASDSYGSASPRTAAESTESQQAHKSWPSFEAYKDAFYMNLTQNAVSYGWLLTVLTAASPLMDSSYVEKNQIGHDVFRGLGTVRCSEMGYWNYFTPVLDYSSAQAYEESIASYVERGLIQQPSELYYPVRLKPYGNYNEGGLDRGISHIELRMFDLNPLCKELVNVQDIRFAQLFLIWAASFPALHLSEKDQVQAAQNFKYASHYDLKTVVLALPDGRSGNAIELSKGLIDCMIAFFSKLDTPQELMDSLFFQQEKILDSSKRYTRQVREKYSHNFVEKGVTLAVHRSIC